MKNILFLTLLLISVNSLAQITNKKKLNAVRINEPIKIDAKFDESAWQNIPKADNFTQIVPINGSDASQKTEVKIIYDDKAIYIAASLYDNSPDSILMQYTERDNNRGMVDMFGVYLDPFNDALNAYGFFVTAAGVQIDIKMANNDEDDNWDAVWRSEVRISDKGWFVEMEIPYSALRFPKKEIQVWGINMFRNIQRHREETSWNFIDREIDDKMKQAGELHGIKNVIPPLRLSFSPYLSSYAEHHGETDSWAYSVKGGMDVKYGINESFTLDMMLIPDFGQVQSDDQVLNLSPFETYYDEKRQFFIEGAELFDKAEIFYSRRIGGRPFHYYDVYNQLNENEEIEENPLNSQMINATKISGKTKHGLGIGFLNSMTLPTFAKIKNTETGETREYQTQAFTNYNVFSIDQSLKNNSYISIINTNFKMAGTYYNANVTGTDFKLVDNSHKYAIFGKGALTQKYISEDENQFGYYYDIEIEKIAGAFRFSLSNYIESDTYDPNDMGFLRANNEVVYSGSIGYNVLKPLGNIITWNNTLSFHYATLYKPMKYTGNSINFNTFILNKNYFAIGGNVSARLKGDHDYYEPRIDGWYYEGPKTFMAMGFISTDYRKMIALDLRGGFWDASFDQQGGKFLEIEPRFRPTDKILLVLEIEYDQDKNTYGHVYNNGTDQVVFGRRDVTTYENTLKLSYIMNTKSSLSLRMRQYWSSADYKDFYLLNKNDGTLNIYDGYNENNDINYNAFTIDLVYKWQFAPGSELSLVWKNAISSGDDYVIRKYRDNIDRLFDAHQNNSFSFKILYYIDYQYLVKRSKKNI